MKDLNFNIYAFVKPSTKEEYSSLLDEAIRLADELEEQIENLDISYIKEQP